MDYSIIESGGKQYVAREGQALEVDRLPVEAGQAVEFNQVLLVSDRGQVRIGTPLVAGMKVHATVAGNVKGDKIVVFRYIPQERFRKKAGHRQLYTRVPSSTASASRADGRRARPRRRRLRRPGRSPQPSRRPRRSPVRLRRRTC